MLVFFVAVLLLGIAIGLGIVWAAEKVMDAENARVAEAVQCRLTSPKSVLDIMGFLDEVESCKPLDEEESR